MLRKPRITTFNRPFYHFCGWPNRLELTLLAFGLQRASPQETPREGLQPESRHADHLWFDPPHLCCSNTSSDLPFPNAVA